MRLFISLKLLKNDDVAWLTSIMCIPSYVELGAGIITSCLPTLPKFFKTMAQIPRVAKFGASLSSIFKSSAPPKRTYETSSRYSWNQGRNEPSIPGAERRGWESYNVLEGSQHQHDAFSTTSLGNVAMAKGTGNERDNLEMVPVDEEMGILRSVRISIVRHSSPDPERNLV